MMTDKMSAPNSSQLQVCFIQCLKHKTKMTQCINVEKLETEEVIETIKTGSPMFSIIIFLGSLFKRKMTSAVIDGYDT